MTSLEIFIYFSFLLIHLDGVRGTLRVSRISGKMSVVS